MKQADLIARITTALNGMERISAALLGGSYGRGEADDYSDVDVYVVVGNADDIAIVLTALVDKVDTIAPILFSKPLPNSRTINSITTEWLRFDFTVVSEAELVFFARDQIKPLFDPLNVVETLRPTTEPRRNLSPEGLLDIVNEFIRVLGLSVVVNGRDDLVVAHTGTNLLRDMLIRIMSLQNPPQPQRGALSLRRGLTTDQFETLLKLPALEATWVSTFARTKALAEQFFPRARALAKELGAAWPEEFARVTLAHVEEKLGLKIRAG